MTQQIVQGPYILRPKTVYFRFLTMTHRIIQGPYSLRSKDRIHSVLMMTHNLLFKDHIFYALKPFIFGFNDDS